MRFGEMLKQARVKAGLTQAALAERLRLPLRSIQNWEQGHRVPRMRTVATLSKALGVPQDDLYLALARQWISAATAKKPGRKKKQ
jgi:transcriptional regulator with XRE-family HTH domain